MTDEVIFCATGGLFFTSDTHFGHANIIKYTGRPFASSEEMDEALIANWNEAVPKDGTVYHLGDFALCSRTRAAALLARLNGEIHLILGNHDRRAPAGFASVTGSCKLLILINQWNKHSIVLTHRPDNARAAQWPGAWHLHGHLHSSPLPGRVPHRGFTETQKGRLRLDVGVDAHGFAPISYARVLELMTQKDGQNRSANGQVPA